MQAPQPPSPGVPPYGQPPPGFPQQPYPPQQRGWFSRNKLWFIPLVLLIVVGLPAGCIGTVYYGLKAGFGALLDSEIVKSAVTQVNADARATARLGTPIKIVDQFPPFSGSIKVENDTGSADFTVPVAGPKGKGSLAVRATRSGGRWTYQAIELTPDDGSGRIQIIGGTRL